MNNKRISALGVLSDYLIAHIPNDFKSKKDIIKWLDSSIYSPYVTLYGGINSKLYDENSSFISDIDNKKRYNLKDEIIFKFQNFINVENSIYSADTKLSDAIDAKVLFASYPQFRDINIVINVSNSNNNNYSGSTYYDVDTNNPYKIEVYADSNENAMRVLIHELQHCIQLKEGFEVGESYYGGEGVCEHAGELKSKYFSQNGNYLKNVAKSRAKGNKLPYVEYKKDDEEYFNTLFPDGKIRTPDFMSDITIQFIDYKKLSEETYKGNKRNEDRSQLLGSLFDVALAPQYILEEDGKLYFLKFYEYQPHINDEDIKFPHKKHEPFRIATFAVNKFGEIELLSHYNTDYLETFRGLVKNATLLVELTDDGYCFYKSSGAIASSALIHHPLEDSSGLSTNAKEIISNSKKEVNSKNDNIIFHKKDNPLLKEDREKNFKDWFGDSKVVDENGEPLVVYHGTGASFDEFATNPISWVSTSHSHANKYADKVVPDWKISKNNVMPLYISVKNPYCFKVAEFAKTTEREMMIDMMMDTENRKKIDRQNIDKIESLIKKADRRSEQACLIWNSSSNLKEVALLLGYDGYEAFEVDSSMNEKKTYYKTYAAFSPTQIKSIHNKGTFDPKNPNILEKNDYGLRHIEKIISIIPNGMSKDGIYKYLELNNVSKEDIRDTSFYSVIENDIFINAIKNTDSINKDSSYWNNKGEIESREIEDKYISLSSIIKIDDSIENMSDSEIKDMLTKLAYNRADIELV